MWSFARDSNAPIRRASSAAEAAVWIASAASDGPAVLPEAAGAGPGAMCVASATTIAAMQSAIARIFMVDAFSLREIGRHVGRCPPHVTGGQASG